MVTFVVLLGIFVGVSGYCIDQTVKAVNDDSIIIDNEDLFGNPTQLRNFILSVVGLSMLSLVMCVVFVFLTKNYPKCMVYGVIAFVSSLFIAGAIAFFFAGLLYLSIMILITLAIYLGLMFCCFKKHLKTAIVLVKVTGTFLTERPLVYIIPLVMSIFTMLFTMLWAGSIIGLTILGGANPPPIEPGTTLGLFFIQIFGYIFFVFFTYYVMVFLVASCVAIWYYQSRKNMITSGIKWLFQAHIGSITFGAMIITIIKILQAMAKGQKKTNAAAAVARAVCICLLNALEKFVKIMNRFAVIIMSFTGEDFVTSCKSTGIIIFKNLGVFSVITIVSNFFYYSGLLLCAGIPTALTGIIVSNIDIKDTSMPILLVFFSSLLISNTFLTTFTETLTSVFVFYSLDLQLQEYGINIVNIPSDMQLLLEHAFDDSEDYRESFLDKAKKERDIVHTDDTQHNIGQYMPPPANPNYGYPPPQYYQPTAYGAPPPNYPGGPPPPQGYPGQQQPYYQPPPPYYQPPHPNQ